MIRLSLPEDVACGRVARALASQGIPLGPRGKDVNTVKNWRKDAYRGQVGVDPDATIYASIKESLLARTDPIDVIIADVLDAHPGNSSSCRQKLKYPPFAITQKRSK
jgi:hypothetical protein